MLKKRGRLKPLVLNKTATAKRGGSQKLTMTSKLSGNDGLRHPEKTRQTILVVASLEGRGADLSSLAIVRLTRSHQTRARRLSRILRDERIDSLTCAETLYSPMVWWPDESKVNYSLWNVSNTGGHTFTAVGSRGRALFSTFPFQCSAFNDIDSSGILLNDDPDLEWEKSTGMAFDRAAYLTLLAHGLIEERTPVRESRSSIRVFTDQLEGTPFRPRRKAAK